MPSTRQLAAIMFTDIQGYTALMQRNEKRAVSLRARHRRIFNTTTEKFQGRILQYYGDGTLSIFDSAVDAVQCGIEMQRNFQKEPAIPVRIGIHTGDIIFSDEEIIGDGVNVASRIESLAVAGSVFISDKVYDEIKNHESIKTSMMKSFRLKNVRKPIDVYAISNMGLIVPNPDEIKGKTEKNLNRPTIKPEPPPIIKHRGLSLTAFIILILAIVTSVYLKFGTVPSFFSEYPENSIAVLAFDNMIGDPNQEYFSDGISEEILNVLAKVDGLKVAGRTSAFSFKGKEKDIRLIGKKLGVGMVLEGSVRKSDNKVRITAQLIETKNGFHLWSETYDRESELSNLFVIQDEIAAKIVEKLKLEVRQPTISKDRKLDIKAHDSLLKGTYFLNKDVEGTNKALEHFQKALELDPNYATAYALLGDTYINQAVYGFMPNTEAYSKARAAAQKAISLNEREAIAHRALAYIHLMYDWDWESALSAYNKALEYGLPHPDHFVTFYEILLHENFKQAIHAAQKRLERDPLQMQCHWHLGFCYLFSGKLEDALNAFNDALELDPNYSEGHRWKGITLAYLGQFEEAYSSLERALEITEGQGPANFDLLVIQVLMGKEEETLQVLDEWERSGEHVDPFSTATLYALLEMPDRAFAWLEKAYQERSFMMISLKAYWIWDQYRDDPRFMEIYDKMNFPE